MAKNRGPLLIDKIRGTLEVLPAWVRRYVKYTVTKQKVDAKVPLDPDDLTGTLVASELRQEVTDERLKLNTELDPAALPAERTGQQVLPNGQVATVTERVDDAPQVLVESATLEEGVVENVGDISMLRKVDAPSVLPFTLYSKERPETIPPRFRAAVPSETTRLDTAGTPVMPTLAAGDVTKTSEQTRVGVRRDTTTNRPTTDLPVELLGQELTPEGQVAVVTENLDDTAQTITPSPTQIQAAVENLGNGLTLKTTKVVPSVFPNNLFQAERPELIPIKFRGALPLTTTRTDVAGTAAAPTLAPGDVTKSSEQIREGVKRDLSALRNATALPVVLVGQELSPQGQLMTVTETLDDTAQTTSESALKLEGSVENLGDGLTLKTEKTVTAVLGEALFAKERPEVLPPKFRAALPATTTRLDSAGTAAAPTLAPGDVSKSSEQLRVGVKRDTVVVREVASPPTLTGQQLTTEFGGDLASVVESVVADGTAADAGVGVISSEVETLGDGTSTKRTVQRTSGAWPTLLDFEFDERLKVFTRIEKTVVPVASATAPSISSGITTEFKGLDKWRSVQIVSKFDTAVVGTSTERKVTGKYSFPDSIVRCEFIFAQVSVSSEFSFSLSLDVDIKDGPSGAFPGRLVETVVSDPTVALPAVFQYKTTHGTISIAYVYGIFALVNGRLAATANSQTWSIPPSLHPALNPTLSDASGVAVTEGDGVVASSPTVLNSGDEILIDVGVDAWRFNTYILSKLYITVPTLA